MLKIQAYGGHMQIGSAASLLNSIGQALAPPPGSGALKTDTSSKNARQDQHTGQALAQAPTQSDSVPQGSTKRGSYVNLVV